MAKPVKPAKKKKSGNLLVHVVLLLLLATVGWPFRGRSGPRRRNGISMPGRWRMSSRKTRRCGATSQKVPPRRK